MAENRKLPTSLFLDPEIDDRLRKLATRDGVSMGQVIRECITLAINEREKLRSEQVLTKV